MLYRFIKNNFTDVHGKLKDKNLSVSLTNGIHMQCDQENITISGRGKISNQNYIYIGGIELNLPHNKGIEMSDTHIYLGYFYRGLKHGHGEYVLTDGSFFSGQFIENKKEDYGKLSLSDGSIFEGN